MPDQRPIIAHVLHRLDRAGAEVLAAGLARAMRGRYESVFFCLDGLGPLAQELRDDGFVVECFDRQPGIDRGVARRMRKRIAELNVDLLHGHQYTPFFYSSLARGLLPWQQRSLPLIFSEHGRHYPDYFSIKRYLANKLLIGGGDAVTAVGAFVLEAVVKNEGLRGEVIYNGIEPSPPRTRPGRAQARSALGLSDDAPVVMQVARFHPVKDHATAIRAFASALDSVPDATFVLIGDGPTRDDMKALAEQLGIGERIRFIGIRSDVRDLLRAADVFLLSSLSEGISVTLLEAMDAGLPIVATDVGGNGEVVEHKKTGLLAPRGDHAALGEALAGLLSAPAQATAYGAAGRERLNQRFTQATMHAAYAKLYDKLLGQR